jgi:hypothetical protein
LPRSWPPGPGDLRAASEAAGHEEFAAFWAAFKSALLAGESDRVASMTEFFIGYGNHTAAGLLVYFSNRRLSSKDGPASGLTFGGQTLLHSWAWTPTSQREQMVLTLAHEIGHFLSPPGHDPDKDDLMFDGLSHGKRIRKKRNLQFARGL